MLNNNNNILYMAYNISYSTLPTLDSNSIGYTITRRNQGYTPSPAYAWFDSSSITLTPGVYTLSANCIVKNSSNTHVFILCNSYLYQSIGSIWFYDQPSGIQAFQAIMQFDNFSDTTQLFGGKFATYQSYSPVACQSVRQPVTNPQPAAQVSLSTTLTVSAESIFVVFICSGNVNSLYCLTFTATRIA